jgi:hypothetical protein
MHDKKMAMMAMQHSHCHGSDAQSTAQSKAHRRRRLPVYGSPVVVLAQKATFCKKT